MRRAPTELSRAPLELRRAPLELRRALLELRSRLVTWLMSRLMSCEPAQHFTLFIELLS